MGFWDIFRKKKEPELKDMEFQGVQAWIEKKKNELKETEREFISNIKSATSDFIEKLTALIPVLENVDVNEKKAQEKIKFLTEENKQRYIVHLQKLIENLRKIGEENLIEKINKEISYFEKKSFPSFQKATLLIGKEMEDIKKAITEYLAYLKRLVKENQEFINELNVLSEIDKKYKDFLNLQESIKRAEEKIKEIDEKKSSLKNKVDENKGEIEQVKRSKKFLEQEKKKELIKSKELEIDALLDSLKEKINFKALANFYHSFEKEMSIVKFYRDNFKFAFQKNNGKDLINLLEESGIEKELVGSISEIAKKMSGIKDIKTEPTGLENLEKEINDNLLIIEKNEIMKVREQKRKDKLNEDSEKVKQAIAQEFKNINIKII